MKRKEEQVDLAIPENNKLQKNIVPQYFLDNKMTITGSITTEL